MVGFILPSIPPAAPNPGQGGPWLSVPALVLVVRHAGGGPAAVGFRCMRVAGKTVCAFGVSCTQKKVDFWVLSKLSVPLGPRAPYCPVRSCPYLPSPAPPAVRWTVRTFKIGVSNIARHSPPLPSESLCEHEPIRGRRQNPQGYPAAPQLLY